MKARVRQAEAKEAADNAIAERRRRKQVSERRKEESVSIPEKSTITEATVLEEAVTPTDHGNDETEPGWTVVRRKKPGVSKSTNESGGR